MLFGIFLGVAPNFSLKKIKNNQTQPEKIEKINNNFLVSKFEARKVPINTPAATNKPKDLINVKSTASYFI